MSSRAVPHEPDTSPGSGARLNGDRAIRERRRHIVTPNTESLRKGAFAEAARYVITRPQLPPIHFFGKKKPEKVAALKPLPSPFYYAVTSKNAYGRTANGAVQGRIFMGIDPPRWRISVSVGKRLKKCSIAVIRQFVPVCIPGLHNVSTQRIPWGEN